MASPRWHAFSSCARGPASSLWPASGPASGPASPGAVLSPAGDASSVRVGPAALGAGGVFAGSCGGVQPVSSTYATRPTSVEDFLKRAVIVFLLGGYRRREP